MALVPSWTGLRRARVALACTMGALAAACASSRQSAPPTSARTTAPVAAPPGQPAQGPAPAACSAPTTGGGAGGKDVNPPGDIPDNQAFVAYSSATGGYTLKVPEGWARAEGPTWASFTDKLNTVRVDLVAAPDPPTVESAKAAEVPTIAASAPCFRLVDVATVTRAAGAAVRLRYQAQGPPDPVTAKVRLDDVERYEFWRNGTEAVLTLSAPAGSDNADPWTLISNSFAWR